MNALITPELLVSINECSRTPMCLEDLLINLCRLGVPTVHKLDKGWWVTLRMHSSMAGAEMKIEITATAAIQCAQRAIAVLQKGNVP